MSSIALHALDWIGAYMDIPNDSKKNDTPSVITTCKNTTPKLSFSCINAVSRTLLVRGWAMYIHSLSVPHQSTAQTTTSTRFEMNQSDGMHHQTRKKKYTQDSFEQELYLQNHSIDTYTHTKKLSSKVESRDADNSKHEYILGTIGHILDNNNNNNNNNTLPKKK
jgi:hypothetical protein